MMKQFLFILSMFCSFSLIAQDETENKYQMQTNPRTIEIDILSSYYEQDGQNAAVTGGIGTEELQDVATIVTLNIPLDSVNSINLYTGLDYYTSASTDLIDNNMSSASSQDVRAFGTLTYSRLNPKRNETYSAKIGFSTEYDYNSISGGLSYTKEWNEGNSEITFSGQAFIDKWQLIYPQELRGFASLKINDRKSFNGQIQFAQILTKRLQLGLSAEMIYMKGVLSTPFHRVYFADQDRPDIEKLPDARLKIPFGIRLNYFPMDNLVIRTNYRFYYDDFGIIAHTIGIETPIKIGQKLTISPFYRFHIQSESDYFEPYKVHLATNDFYTSDYDLSGLSSHKYGLEVKYNPLYGLMRSKPFLKSKRVFMVKYLGVRLARYERNTGLESFIGSLNVGISIK